MTLSKRTLKKLLIDSSTGTAVSFENISNKQKEGVSMAPRLASALANIILTEFDNKHVVQDLLNSKILPSLLPYCYEGFRYSS